MSELEVPDAQQVPDVVEIPQLSLEDKVRGLQEEVAKLNLACGREFHAMHTAFTTMFQDHARIAQFIAIIAQKTGIVPPEKDKKLV